MLCSQCYGSIESFGVDGSCEHCGKDPRLQGRYRLMELVGQGASGRTYRSIELEGGREVAVKELLFHRIDTLKRHELFEREGRVLEQLAHPQIPQFVETFDVEGDRSHWFYIVQEFIAGESLAVVLKGRRFDEEAALRFLDSIGAPLEYLHGLPTVVVHRDLKPSNIMLRESDQEYVLIDFGTVRDAVNKTGEGSTIAGTFGYMAPEQFRGDATAASDVYGLGMTVLAMLSGQEFLSREASVAYLARMNVSGGLRGLLQEMLRVEPASRPDIRSVRLRALALLEGREEEPVSRSAGVSAGVRSMEDLRASVAARHRERERGREQGWRSGHVKLILAVLLLPAALAASWTNQKRMSRQEGHTVVRAQVPSEQSEQYWRSEDARRAGKRQGRGIGERAWEYGELLAVEARFAPVAGEFMGGVENRSLGGFTLGMSWAEVFDASDGRAEFVREYSARMTPTNRDVIYPPYLGRLFVAPASFDGQPALCELGLVVGNRLSEINCGLIVSTAEDGAFETFQRAQMRKFREVFGAPTSRGSVWETGEQRLTVHFSKVSSGESLENRVLYGADSWQTNVVYHLRLLEHERVLDEHLKARRMGE